MEDDRSAGEAGFKSMLGVGDRGTRLEVAERNRRWPEAAPTIPRLAGPPLHEEAHLRVPVPQARLLWVALSPLPLHRCDPGHTPGLCALSVFLCLLFAVWLLSTHAKGPKVP